jgi:lysine 2,3-aminomutase
VTGGDPLTMSTQALDVILNKLRSISHVEILRIGTKVPAVLPMRIDDELVSMLQKYAPLYINIHFIHPSELTTESKAACLKLAKAGIPLGSQTVLLKDINDDPVIMKELMQKLLTVCVKPYYIYLCDQTTGNKHFRTNVKTGINIIENLRGWTSGLAVPHLIIDSAEGKIPISPKYAEKTGNKWVLRGYKNKQFLY